MNVSLYLWGQGLITTEELIGKFLEAIMISVVLGDLYILSVMINS